MISLAERRHVRRPSALWPRPEGAEFFFALNCPLSYLVAERIERDLGEASWVPLVLAPQQAGERLALAQFEARELRLPLVKPAGFGSDVRRATRVAAWAAARGAGRQFGLAALRLAFCGGYDLADTRSIAATAVAADLPVREALAQATELHADAALHAAARRIHGAGMPAAPVIRIGAGWYHGYEALSRSEAFTAARAQLRAGFSA